MLVPHPAAPARDRVCTCSLPSRLPPVRSCSCCGDIARTPNLCFRWRRSHGRRTRTRRRLHCDARGRQCICSRSCLQIPGPISRRADRGWAPPTPADSMRGRGTASTPPTLRFPRLRPCACGTFRLRTGDMYPRRGSRSRGCTRSARWRASPCDSVFGSRWGTISTAVLQATAGTCPLDRHCTFAQTGLRGRSPVCISNKSGSLPPGARNPVCICSRPG
jgi:hypothetical protein